MKENEGIKIQEARNCILCELEGKPLYKDMHDRLFGAPGSWNLMRCCKCNLVWLNPQPTSEDIAKLYANYFTHQNHEDKRILAGLRIYLNSSILMSCFNYPLKNTNKIIGSILGRIRFLKDISGSSVMWLEFSEKSHLLDVGCGNGLFLAQMKKLGWEVTGVEPDGNAASIARDKYGLNVFEGSLVDQEFPESNFDAITLNHVIEHAIDPIGLMRECRRILRPGGKLIAVTPNIDSLAQHLFHEAWLHLDPPRHMFLFSFQALHEAAKRAGLTISELRTTAKGARWIWVSSSIIKRDSMFNGVSLKKPGPSLRLQGLAFQLAEHVYRSDSGEELVLIATR